MFCYASPIWHFLRDLDAREAPEAPEEARIASTGLYIMEVFPALAMPSMNAQFFGRLAAPRYNPARKTFSRIDWENVATAAASRFDELGLGEAAEWCREAAGLPRIRKADQDQLDAMICLWVALHWRLRARAQSLLLGSLEEGYMVVPATPVVRDRLEAAARLVGISVA